MGEISINITAESVAWYGAIVATFSFIVVSILSVLTYLRDRAMVKIEKSEGFLIFDSGTTSENQVFLKAINTGRRMITLTGAGFRLYKKGNLIFPNPKGMQFPYELGEGKAVQLWEEKSELLKQIKKTRSKIKYAWFSDATGKIYKCKCEIKNK